jgi:hypothetical protein
MLPVQARSDAGEHYHTLPVFTVTAWWESLRNEIFKPCQGIVSSNSSLHLDPIMQTPISRSMKFKP